MAASAVCPSASGLRCRSIGGICRKGFAGFPSSQVNMFPDAWPPAIVERSADMLIEVTEPLSIAMDTQINDSSRLVDSWKLLTLRAWANDRFEILVVVEDKYYAF